MLYVGCKLLFGWFGMLVEELCDLCVMIGEKVIFEGIVCDVVWLYLKNVNVVVMVVFVGFGFDVMYVCLIVDLVVVCNVYCIIVCGVFGEMLLEMSGKLLFDNLKMFVLIVYSVICVLCNCVVCCVI